VVPYLIETERLVLRPWATADVDALAALRQHPEVETRQLICEWQDAFVMGRHYLYGMLRQGEPIGEVGLHPCPGLLPDRKMLSYWIHRSHEGQGYVTEAASALVAVARDLGLDCVEIYTDTDNTRSIAVAHRLGFELSGIYENKHVFCYSFSASMRTAVTSPPLAG